MTSVLATARFSASRMVDRCSCVRGATWFSNIIKSGGFLVGTRKDLQSPDPDVQVCVILEEVLCNTLSASVGYRNDVGALRMTTDLTRCSEVTVLLGLHPLHCSCCEVKTASLSPFGL